MLRVPPFEHQWMHKLLSHILGRFLAFLGFYRRRKLTGEKQKSSIHFTTSNFGELLGGDFL